MIATGIAEPMVDGARARSTPGRPAARAVVAALGAAAVAMLPSRAEASFLHGDTLDFVADILTWVALIIAPVTAIVVFLLIHILPEKIAEKRKHPQTKAIQTLCVLSLFFGGILWPLAWIWAYTKPVLHKLAYGTDMDEEPGHGEHRARSPLQAPAAGRLAPADADHAPVPVPLRPAPAAGRLAAEEVENVRKRLDSLSARMPTAEDVRALQRELASLRERLPGPGKRGA